MAAFCFGLDATQPRNPARKPHCNCDIIMTVMAVDLLSPKGGFRFLVSALTAGIPTVPPCAVLVAWWTRKYPMGIIIHVVTSVSESGSDTYQVEKRFPSQQEGREKGCTAGRPDPDRDVPLAQQVTKLDPYAAHVHCITARNVKAGGEQAQRAGSSVPQLSTCPPEPLQSPKQEAVAPARDARTMGADTTVVET